MSGELTALLLKALRSLAPEEQDKVMSELLSARLEWQPGPLAEPVSHAAPPSLGAHMLSELRVSLASESGGPWRTVPVRLPVELQALLSQCGSVVAGSGFWELSPIGDKSVHS